VSGSLDLRGENRSVWWRNGDVEHPRPRRSNDEGPMSVAVPQSYSGTCTRGGLDGGVLCHQWTSKGEK
jgi:hypothetical protein